MEPFLPSLLPLTPLKDSGWAGGREHGKRQMEMEEGETATRVGGTCPLSHQVPLLALMRLQPNFSKGERMG